MAVADSSLSLGEFLVRESLITQAQLRSALEEQKKSSHSIGRVLVDEGFISEETRIKVLQREFGFDLLDMTKIDLDPLLANLVSLGFAQKHHIIPIRKDGRTLIVAMEDPSDMMVQDLVKAQVGLAIKPFMATAKEIRRGIVQLYRQGEGQGPVGATLQPKRRNLFLRAAMKAAYYLVLFLPLVAAGFGLSIEEVQLRIEDLTAFDIGLYTLLGWGVWAIIIFQVWPSNDSEEA